jgi:tRNA (adenine22-N1)-methyltransferase
MQINIGARLRGIAQFVPAGCRLADIGSDHGYLPAWLLMHQRVTLAIAGEVNPDPARRAEAICREYGLAPLMQVRLGDGLQVLRPGEVDVVVIAGMGGSTIREILSQGQAVLRTVKRLVLQPNVGGAELRRWLVGHHFAIADEDLVLEKDIIYEIIVAEPGESLSLGGMEAELGPVLLQRRPELFKQRVRMAIAEREYIVSQLTRANSAGAHIKRERLQAEIESLREVLA